MKRCVISLLVICVIGLCSCNSRNATASNNSSVEQNQNTDSPRTITNVHAEVKIDTNNPNAETVNVNKEENVEPSPPPELNQFKLSGWYPWPTGAVTSTQGAASNERIISSNGRRLPDAAGIANEHIDPNLLRGKTLILCFANTNKSSYNGDQMIKVEYDEKIILYPVIADHFEGFIYAEDRPINNGVEYEIPDTFNGKLSFVFYKAILNDLKITAYYK